MSNPPEEYAGLHVVELRIENTKRIRAVTIRPDGQIVTIGGDNDQGKTSVLESIEMGLGGGDQIIEEPIRRGAKKARVVIDLGDIIVTRTFTKAGSTLVVTGKDGTPKKSPQELLNRLTSAVAFDPFGFTLLKPPAQAEVLRGIVKLDFTAIDAARLKAFNERTLVNRDLEQQKALVARLPFHKDAPEAEESSAAILAEIEKANAHNKTVDAALSAAETAQEDLGTCMADLDAAKIEVERVEKLLSDAKAKVTSCETELAQAKKNSLELTAAAAALVPIEAAPLTARLTGLESANAKVRANKQRADAEAAVKAKQTQSDALSLKIQNCDEQRETILKEAKFPVPGLSFGENGVLLDGLPFSQAGDAEQIRVSVAIAAALNPKIRVMLIHDGSLIGTRKMELIRQLAKEHNLQVWIELVSDKDDKKSSVVIEDGHVVGQEVPEEPAEPEIKGHKPSPAMIDESTLTSESQPTLDLPPQ